MGRARCATAMLLVGSSVVASSVLHDFPVYAGQALRYGVAAVILATVMKVAGYRWAPVRPTDWALLTSLAACGLVIFNVAVVEATKLTSPSLIGAVLGATPVVLAVVGAVAAGRSPQPRVLASAVIIGVGVVLIQGAAAASTDGLILALVALAGEVSFSLLAVPVLRRMGAVQLSTMACVLSVPLLAAAGLLRDDQFIRHPSVSEWLGLAWLAVIVTALAFVLWYSGLHVLGPERAGVFAGLIPVGALAVSVLLAQETLRFASASGCALVGIAIWFAARPAGANDGHRKLSG